MTNRWVLFSLNYPISGNRYEIVIVEDNSPDGTYEVAVELQVSI